MTEEMYRALRQIRHEKPLVLHLTNYVTMDAMANVLLALGGAPLMTASSSELAELIQISACVVINLGTLDELFIERCELACALAKRFNKPVLLDPVGAGATKLRTEAAERLLAYASIIKGNASEILALVGETAGSKGVESTDTVEQAMSAATNLACTHDNVVVVSGEIDFITDESNCQSCVGGSSLMTQVTGMGCALGSVIAAFHSVSDNAFTASCMAVDWYNRCGSVAAISATGPGSFRVAMLDCLSHVDNTQST